MVGRFLHPSWHQQQQLILQPHDKRFSCNPSSYQSKIPPINTAGTMQQGERDAEQREDPGTGLLWSD